MLYLPGCEYTAPMATVLDVLVHQEQSMACYQTGTKNPRDCICKADEGPVVRAQRGYATRSAPCAKHMQYSAKQKTGTKNPRDSLYFINNQIVKKTENWYNK